MYLGSLFALIWFAVPRWSYRIDFNRKWWIYFMTSAGILIVDLIIGIWKVQGWVVPRFITGYLFGAAATFGAWSFLVGRVGVEVRSKSIDPLLVLLTAGTLAAWIGAISVLSPTSWGAGVVSVPVALGLLGFWGVWNSVLLVLVFPRLPLRPGRIYLGVAFGVGVLMFFIEASASWFLK